jgi:hypothetical protein
MALAKLPVERLVHWMANTSGSKHSALVHLKRRQYKYKENAKKSI